MKNNKLVSIILALLVCLTMVVSASAATESDLSFALESKDSSVELLNSNVVKSGDTFTIAVNIEKNAGFKAARPTVEFDSTKLEFVEAKNGIDGVKIFTEKQGTLRINIGNINAAFNPSQYETITTTGTIVELTFKVLEKSDLKTAITVNVTQSNVCDANGKFKATVSGGSLELNVVAADHSCSGFETIENGAVAPTCTVAGKEADKICTHCGKVVTEGAEIAALGHTEDEGTVTKEPTCTEMGTRVYKCTVCGETTRTDDHVTPVGHSFGEWKVTKEATVEAEGEETRTCSVCGQKETRSIEKLEPVKSNNTVLIVVIVVVVVLAGAGVAAYFVLKNKKK